MKQNADGHRSPPAYSLRHDALIHSMSLAAAKNSGQNEIRGFAPGSPLRGEASFEKRKRNSYKSGLSFWRFLPQAVRARARIFLIDLTGGELTSENCSHARGATVWRDICKKPESSS